MTANNHIRRYDVQPDGTVTNGRELIDLTVDKAPGVTDGMRVDSREHLFDPAPRRVDHLPGRQASGHHSRSERDPLVHGCQSLLCRRRLQDPLHYGSRVCLPDSGEHARQSRVLGPAVRQLSGDKLHQAHTERKRTGGWASRT